MRYVFVILMFAISGCERSDHRFSVLNNTEAPVYYFMSDSDEYYAVRLFDRFHPDSPALKNAVSVYYIASHRKRQHDILGSWSDFLDAGFTNGIAKIYWIDSADLGKGAKKMVKKGLIKKIEVNSHYMDRHDWYLTIE